MCSDCWTPMGDLMKAAVVRAASAGKERSHLIQAASRESGMKKVQKPTKMEAIVANLECLRKGCGGS
jgi:hypothetical protein